MSLEDVKGLIVVLLVAAVHANSGVVNRNLIHLADRPDKRARLRSELSETPQGGTGRRSPSHVCVAHGAHAAHAAQRFAQSLGKRGDA